ncbi:MAG: prolyl oligopeptidase family serine peptidase [Bryobacteraceae bacterium]|jgi:dipeptidyl aminopeptidase/acylaminoacyl peptidase
MSSRTRLSLTTLLLLAPAAAQQPPLIDRELFFGDPEISGAQISPDGKYIAFLKPLNKTRNIWVKKTDAPFDSAKPITNDTKRPIPGYLWSRDGKYVLYAQDKLGDENYNVYAVDPAAAPVAPAEVPAARNLTDLKGVRAMIYDVPRSEPDIIYVGLNDRDKSWHDLYKVRISTGERTLLRQNTDRITGWIFDLKDQLRLASRSADNGDTEILRVDEKGFTKIYSCDVLETCEPVRFHKDGKRFYLETNKGEGENLEKLVLMDAETGKEELVERDPENRVDFGSALFSEVSDQLIATVYQYEKTRIYWKDKTFEADYKSLEGKLPGNEINFASHTRDEQLWLISAHSDTEPGQTFLFDRQSKKLTPQYKIREKLPRQDLAHMEAIRYESSDGLEIPAYLTLPKGVHARNLPTLILPHGGPWGRDAWGYNSFAQFFANRGYAVLEPNFRSSTGYGKKFLNAGNRQWGDKMQDDLTWGAKYLAAKGIADPKRTGIIGGSYGGYATLAGVTFTPELYAAAVSIVGPSNLITLLDSIPPYWEPIRKMFYQRMGDPNTPEGKAQLQRQSPLNSAGKIKTPLMVVQGLNDPRVNKAESDQIVIALRDRGFPVEYLVAPDEGHGFARPVNNMAMIAASEKFFAHYLGGQYQEDMTPEVATRLTEITVDPKTVVLARKIAASAVSALKIATPLQPGVLKYKVTIQMGTQSIPLTMANEIKAEDGAWTVTNRMMSPMGDFTEGFVLDQDTLAVRKRSVHQGPTEVELAFQDNKVTGSMKMNGADKPIAVDIAGPVFPEVSAVPAVLACLPLAEGYATAFRTFDVRKQKDKVMQLQVLGSEKVTVPAGTFDAFKVEVADGDGGAGKITVWIAKESRKPVKFASIAPEMGGATVTAELSE